MHHRQIHRHRKSSDSARKFYRQFRGTFTSLQHALDLRTLTFLKNEIQLETTSGLGRISALSPLAWPPQRQNDRNSSRPNGQIARIGLGIGTMRGERQFGKADQGIFSYWIHSWMARRSLTYLGFGGMGYQVRDCFHPRDLVALLMKQTAANGSSKPRVVNLGGGPTQAMSLADLSAWCADRFGHRDIASDGRLRQYDVPWVVMDSMRAKEVWKWSASTTLEQILDEIDAHAESHPKWLELSGTS